MARFAEIQTALDTRLASLADSPPVAWPNITYEPTEGETWIRPTVLPNNATPVGIATGETIRTLGLYQIDIFTPAGGGPGAGLSLADRIAALFPYGQRVTRGGSAVVFGAPAIDPASASGAWYRVAVVIPFDVLT